MWYNNILNDIKNILNDTYDSLLSRFHEISRDKQP